MGLFGMIGKMAGSKVVEKVEDELTKKQNREQTSKYSTYINNNIDRVCKLLDNMRNEEQCLINEILSMKGAKMSFREKGEFKKTKEKAYMNLKYLYLSRDFFTALTKNASGILLQNEELMLVSKFAPYFDGVPVLDMDDEDYDDSVLGMFKEVAQEFRSVFVSSKKDSKHFDFEEYLYRYEGKFAEYVIPDIDGAIESFKNTMSALDNHTSATVATHNPATDVSITAFSDDIECPNCNTKLGANSKFCPECGNKIEIKKPAFCTQCGEPVAPGAKFCANCGAKV